MAGIDAKKVEEETGISEYNMAIPNSGIGYFPLLLKKIEKMKLTKRKDYFKIAKFYLKFIPSIKYYVMLNKELTSFLKTGHFSKFINTQNKIRKFNNTNGQFIFNFTKPILDK